MLYQKEGEEMPRLVPNEFLRAARDAAHGSASPQEAEAKINLAYRSMVRSLHQGETQKRVIVVNGAPGSGKTHFVKRHIQSNDIALDLDYITAALALDEKLYGDRKPQLDVALAIREALFTEVEARRGAWETAYIITAEKDRRKVQALADRLDAELVTIDTTPEQCRAHIRSDARREGYTERYLHLVDEWYENRD